MPNRGFGVVPAADGWHLAAIHKHEPDTIHLYAIAAWLAVESDEGDPELLPFIAHCHMGSLPVEVFSARDALAAIVVPPDGTLDEDALRERAADANRRG